MSWAFSAVQHHVCLIDLSLQLRHPADAFWLLHHACMRHNMYGPVSPPIPIMHLALLLGYEHRCLHVMHTKLVDIAYGLN